MANYRDQPQCVQQTMVDRRPESVEAINHTAANKEPV